jgi:uncharacterized protein YjbJ (UPF0337 family)
MQQKPDEKLQTDGGLDRIEGKAKELWGEFTGDEGYEAEGQVQQTWGKVQQGVGDLADAAGDIADRAADKLDEALDDDDNYTH